MAVSMQIDGHRLYSDKSCGVVLSGTTARFGDGSWCNLRTGKVVVRGKGYIELDGKRYDSSSSESESVEEQPDNNTVTREFGSFDASELMLHLRTADARIEVHNGGMTHVTATGPVDQVEKVSVELRNGKLNVRDNTTGNGGISTLASGMRTSGFVGRAFKRVLGSAVGDTMPTEIKILVPCGVPLEALVTSLGDATIGDIESPLKLTVSGTGGARVGKVTDLNVELGSLGEAYIAEVQGSVRAVVSGSGDLTINGGQATSLDVRATSLGEVEIGAEAETATLLVAGSGDISVGKVAGNVSAESRSLGEIEIGYIGGDAILRASGSGDIEVVHGDIGHLEATTQSLGEISVHATAQTAELTARGSGDIDVTRVRTQPIERISSLGEITVHRIG